MSEAHDGEHLAKVIPLHRNKLNRPSFEATDPDQLSDPHVVDLVLAQLRHPSVMPADVAKTVKSMLDPEHNEQWATRMRDIIMNIDIPDELYDELSRHYPKFQAMQQFLDQTSQRSDQERLADERKITVMLTDLYAMAVMDNTHQLKPGDVAEVFEKMKLGLRHNADPSV